MLGLQLLFSSLGILDMFLNPAIPFSMKYLKFLPALFFNMLFILLILDSCSFLCSSLNLLLQSLNLILRVFGLNKFSRFCIFYFFLFKISQPHLIVPTFALIRDT